jgi:hypothetical protein
MEYYHSISAEIFENKKKIKSLSFKLIYILTNRVSQDLSREKSLNTTRNTITKKLVGKSGGVSSAGRYHNLNSALTPQKNSHFDQNMRTQKK